VGSQNPNPDKMDFIINLNILFSFHFNYKSFVIIKI
jgi:hypothetical protein